jgi:cysteine desulfurase
MVRLQEIYLDSGATTYTDPKVLEAMLPFFTKRYGNASSAHSFGDEAREALDKSRKIIAKSLRAKPEEIIFTSGGTEANNFAIKSIAFSNRHKGNHIITTNVDHKCILKSCKWLEEQGFKVTYLPVDEQGFIQPDQLEKAITPETILFSAMHGNNEIGTIMDLQALGTVCKKHGVYFHSDACQSYTKVKIDTKHLPIDLITLNAHKIHGPKGVGALYIREGTNIQPWQSGGSHEFGMRAGTENITGIVGFAESVKLAFNKRHIRQMRIMRNRMIDGLLKIPDVILNGALGDNRLCNNINVCFKGVDGDALAAALMKRNICTSRASACSGIQAEPSYVLKAIGLSDDEVDASVRITISRFTTSEEIEYAVHEISHVIPQLRKKGVFDKVLDKLQ